MSIWTSGRPARALEKLVAETVRMSAGLCPYTIVALSEDEAARIRDLLRGRRGNRAIDVRLATADDIARMRVEGAL